MWDSAESAWKVMAMPSILNDHVDREHVMKIAGAVLMMLDDYSDEREATVRRLLKPFM